MDSIIDFIFNHREAAPLLVFLLTAVIIAISFFIAIRKNKKRILALKNYAESMGRSLEIESPLPSVDKERWPGFFAEGHSRRVRNKISNLKAGRFSFDMFDYEYVIGYGKNRSVRRYECALSKMPRETGSYFPAFSLVPENLFLRIVDKFTNEDIDFEDYPHFSKLYHLKGMNTDDVRKLFNTSVLSCMESHPGLEIYCDGQTITICRHGYLDCEQRASFEYEASEIIQIIGMGWHYTDASSDIYGF